MHPHIEKLYRIASKQTRTIIGLMSGTSLDGLDIALCKITGSGQATTIELLAFETVDYDKEYRHNVKHIFSKKNGDIQHLCIMNAWIASTHANMVNTCLSKWGYAAQDIDLIASHGQTIFHSPASLHQLVDYPNATLQLGDGDHIAVSTGIITISDFRQKHIASGGEGAPLVKYGDYLMFTDNNEDRILLNIGGIANLTFLQKGSHFDQVICCDVGPGNTMMDAYISKHFAPLTYDENGSIAKSGQVNNALLNALMMHPFLHLPLHKTTGPETFNLKYLRVAQQQSNTLSLDHADIIATLNAFSAACISQAIHQLNRPIENMAIYVSGGGIHNTLLMTNISQHLNVKKIASTEELGINPDTKEAILFALLANETVASQPQKSGFDDPLDNSNLTMGKISFTD